VTRGSAVLLALLGMLLGCEPASRAPANVVLIVIDTQRAANLSLYGYALPTSPNLDHFAREATTFDKATAPGTWTVPTHASFFTGLWPSFHGAERVGVDGLVARPINPEVPTLAEILRCAGYATAAFVANVTYVTEDLGFDRGFQRFANDLPWPRADKLLEPAIAWLSEQRAPFFLFVNLLDPHEPYDPPAPYDTKFGPKSREDGAMMTELMHAGTPFTHEIRAHFASQYDGETAFADQALGRFIDVLRARSDYGHTLVLVTSDHGEMLGEHDLAGHLVDPYEPELHVPLVVKFPSGKGAGERITERVSTLGIFATILKTTGLRLPEGTQARPLTEPHPVFAEDVTARGHRLRVAYDGDLKLISRTRPGEPERTRLFDLSKDPGEHSPLADGTGGSAVREQLGAFARLPRPKNNAELPAIDADRERKLRALGYLR
jgi:YD repeat-containing protein